MEQTIEINEYRNEDNPKMLEATAESLLANLPILILGLVVFLAMAREYII